MAEGETNAAIAQALSLSVAAVEKRILALFGKLGLTEETDVHRRVAAVLLYLRERSTG
jgi:DNA-binding NarL/FixJ family response regulator